MCAFGVTFISYLFLFNSYSFHSCFFSVSLLVLFLRCLSPHQIHEHEAASRSYSSNIKNEQGGHDILSLDVVCLLSFSCYSCSCLSCWILHFIRLVFSPLFLCLNGIETHACQINAAQELRERERGDTKFAFTFFLSWQSFMPRENQVLHKQILMSPAIIVSLRSNSYNDYCRRRRFLFVAKIKTTGSDKRKREEGGDWVEN